MIEGWFNLLAMTSPGPGLAQSTRIEAYTKRAHSELHDESDFTRLVQYRK